MPPVYEIVDWLRYEALPKAKDRKKGPMNFISIPTERGGCGFEQVVVQPDGAALLGAWILICEVSARLPIEHRGRLVDRHGHPRTAGDFSRKTGFPEDLFVRAFDFFSGETIGWLRDISRDSADSQDSAELPETPGNPPVRYGNGTVREGKVRYGKGGKNRPDRGPDLSKSGRTVTEPGRGPLNFQDEFCGRLTIAFKASVPEAQMQQRSWRKVARQIEAAFAGKDDLRDEAGWLLCEWAKEITATGGADSRFAVWQAKVNVLYPPERRSK